MKCRVTLYQDKDGTYIAECPSIPGCFSQGRSQAEAEANIADAIRECIAARFQMGMPLTVVRQELEVLV